MNIKQRKSQWLENKIGVEPLSNEFNYKDALVFANKVAGISTTKMGASHSMPTISEVEKY